MRRSPRDLPIRCATLSVVRDTIRSAGARNEVLEAGVTAVAPKPIATRPYPARESVKGSYLLRLFRTTDHKQIGIMYLVTSFAFFMAGGAMAMLIRTELARPGQQFLSQEQYNQLF